MVLRSVKTDRGAARLQGFKLAVTGGTPALQWNSTDYSGLTDNGTGDTSLTFAERFRLAPLLFATPGDDVSSGAYAYQGAATSTSAARVVTANNSGTGIDGTVHGLIYGWDLDVLHNAGWPQRVSVTHMAPRLIPIRLTAPGTMTEGKFQASVSAVDNTSTITFNYPFAVAPTVVAVPDTSGNSVTIVSVSVNQVVLKQYTSAGADGTTGMHIFVLGQDVPNDVFKLRRALKAVQLRPRIVAGVLTNTAGAWSTTNYPDLGTTTDNGTGDVTLTFSKAFHRAPVVLASSTVIGSVAVTSSSTTACRLVAATHAGTATDASIHVLALGFDYVDQQ